MCSRIGYGWRDKEWVYEKELRAQGIKTIYPDAEQQQKIMAVIYQCIKAGKKDVEKYGLDDILKSLIKQGAQSVILGCTELPIAFPWQESEKI